MKKTDIKEVKVLNIAQPHAHNVIFNGKNVENRSKPCSFRGTIAIYASKTLDPVRFKEQNVKNIKEEDCSFGCIVGFVDVVDCIIGDDVTSKTKEWFMGDGYGYVFENVVALKNPIAVSPPKGAIIWWTLSGDQMQQCLDQLPPSREVIPITKAPVRADGKKSKSGTKMMPSQALAEIIGPEPVSYKQSLKKFGEYIDDRDLSREAQGKLTIVADEKLRKLFGKKEIPLEPFEEIKSVMLKNLQEKKAA